MEAENIKTGRSETSVEIFRTNVMNNIAATAVIEVLARSIRSAKINFDLDDCDKILRVEFIGGYTDTFVIMDTVKNLGFEIELLE